jgi:hypothetical protein
LLDSRSAADYYGHIMSEAGVTNDAEPTTFSQEEINKFFGGVSFSPISHSPILP